MKKNEIIELNGKEYTLELNRDSFIQIDKICDVDKSLSIIRRDFYEHIEDIPDDYNPFSDENLISDEDIDKEIELKQQTLNRLCERAFYIWLYPNHKLTLKEVKEIVKPYLEDEKKAEFIGNKLGEYLNKCVEIRQTYNEERKNLKALASKK